MSDISGGPGWWLASDGRWYPPELAPAGPGTATAPGWAPHLPRPATVSPALAQALRVVFLVVAGASGIVACLALWNLLAFNRFADELTGSAEDAWNLSQAVAALFGLAFALLALGLLVLFVVWSWQAHRAASGLGWAVRWRIGWTIGAWCIPCASIVLPKLVIGSIEQLALAPRRDGRAMAMWNQRPSSLLGWVWWIAFVLSTFRFSFQTQGSGSAAYDATVNAGAFRTSYVLAVVGALFGILSALAGAAYTARISDRLTPEGLEAHRND